MDKEHVLLCLMGKTASGKDTLARMLCERVGLNQIISYTTRPRRTNEGDTHIFISNEEYDKLEQSGQIAAFTQIGEYRYCCTVSQLYENDIYVIDPAGMQNLRELNLPNLRFVTIYVNVPDDIRRERALKSRGDDRLVLMRRENAERNQFREMFRNADFDYAISNMDASKAYSVIRWISYVEKVWQNHHEEET